MKRRLSCIRRAASGFLHQLLACTATGTARVALDVRWIGSHRGCRYPRFRYPTASSPSPTAACLRRAKNGHVRAGRPAGEPDLLGASRRTDQRRREQIYATFGMEFIDGKLYVHHSLRFSVYRRKAISGKKADRPDRDDQPAPGAWPLAARIRDQRPPCSGRVSARNGWLPLHRGGEGGTTMAGRDGTNWSASRRISIRMRLDGTELETFATGFRIAAQPRPLNAQDRFSLYDNNTTSTITKLPWRGPRRWRILRYPWILGRHALATCCR